MKMKSINLSMILQGVYKMQKDKLNPTDILINKTTFKKLSKDLKNLMVDIPIWSNNFSHEKSATNKNILGMSIWLDRKIRTNTMYIIDKNNFIIK